MIKYHTASICCSKLYIDHIYQPVKPNLRFFLTFCKVSHPDLELLNMSFDRKCDILYKKKSVNPWNGIY